MGDFSHYNNNAGAAMVDVSEKPNTKRTARASGFLKMSQNTIEMIDKKLIPKGDPFEVARIAGILAAKQVPGLIPMCHPLNISYADVKIEIDRSRSGIQINSLIAMEGKTGVEMEALTAVSIAALTIYDMCKAVDKHMIIGDIKVTEKSGGKEDFKL